jgi:hypothetical protein
MNSYCGYIASGLVCIPCYLEFVLSKNKIISINICALFVCIAVFTFVDFEQCTSLLPCIDINNETYVTQQWMVVVTVSHGFHEMFDNWWYHYKQLKLTMKVKMITEDAFYVCVYYIFAIFLISFKRYVLVY